MEQYGSRREDISDRDSVKERCSISSGQDRSKSDSVKERYSSGSRQDRSDSNA